jgi:hypothetical protein
VTCHVRFCTVGIVIERHSATKSLIEIAVHGDALQERLLDFHAKMVSKCCSADRVKATAPKDGHPVDLRMARIG